MLRLGVLVLVIFVLVGIGSYLAIRVIAHMFNSRRDSWVSGAEELGLSVDASAGGITKKMSGKRGDRDVTITHFAVQKSQYSSDDYAAVEIAIRKAFPFSFMITKPELFYQRVANFFTSDDEIGHEDFDKAFEIECSDTRSMMELLNIEMLDGENSTLIGDLMGARKKYYRVKVSDRSVCLGVRADLGDSTAIEPAIQRAIYLANRFEAAAERI